MCSWEKRARDYYVVGGTMNPDSPSYIERKADTELYEHVLAGEFCYVLTPRQLGKSSLMARTALKLKKKKIKTVDIDLTRFGAEEIKNSPEKWYYGFLYRIIKGLNVDIDISAWWKESEKLSALQRLTEFFKEGILANIKERIVISIDEIDTTLGLPFSDDFFAAIRASYNARAFQPEFKRLNFVLLGVASPSSLIKNSHRTPFNIGQRIELTDFTSSEVKPLSRYLCKNRKDAEAALERILYWTNGHPYLIQKLCRLIAEEQMKELNTDHVDVFVENNFFNPAAAKDSNLSFVNTRLVQEREQRNKRLKLLKLYKKVLSGDTVLDNPLSVTHTNLKLSGIAIPQESRQLCIRNPIYKRIFSKNWLKEVMPVDWTRILTLSSVLLTFFVLLVWAIIPLVFTGLIKSADEKAPHLAYRTLHAIPGYSGKANKLMVEYFDRRSSGAVAKGDRDKGILYHLQALKIEDTKNRRREVSHLIGDDYQNLRLTIRHDGNVGSVILSPDGKTILTDRFDGTIQLWETDGGNPIGNPIKHDEGKILSFDFSPDGNFVVTGGNDNLARLWRSDSAGPAGKTMEHDDWVRAVTFSHDVRYVLTGSDDKTAQLWRMDNGEPVGDPMKHETGIRMVAFSCDDKTVLTLCEDKTPWLWLLDTGKGQQCSSYDGDFFDLTYRNRTPLLLLGIGDTVELWQLHPTKNIGKQMRHTSVVNTVTLSDTIVSFDGRLRFKQTPFDKPQFSQLTRMTYNAPIHAAAISPDGKFILTAGGDNNSLLWSADTQKNIGIMEHDDSVLSATFSVDNRYILTGSADGTAQLWKVCLAEDNAHEVIPIGQQMLHDGPIRFVSFSKTKSTLITAGDDKAIRLWEIAVDRPEILKIKHDKRILSAAFNNDGNILLTGSADKTAQLWDINTKTKIGQPRIHDSFVNPVAFSPDNSIFITGSFNNNGSFSLRTCRLNTEAPHEPWFDKLSAFVTGVAFSPNGKFLISGSLDNCARLWEVNRDNKVKSCGKPMEHGDWVTAVAFSPDNRFILTGSSDGTVRYWRSDSGEIIGKPIEHGDWVTAVTFSSDGRTILSGSKDGFIRLWQWRSDRFEEIGTLHELDDSILDIAFSPDGKAFIAATFRWVHQFDYFHGKTKLKSSRKLPGTWTGAYYFLDEKGNRLHTGVRRYGNFIKIVKLRFDKPDTIPIEYEPDILMSVWQKKLGLIAKENGEIVPISGWQKNKKHGKKKNSNNP